MAEELELNPKQFHVIAFEDPGDSKNFCHIVQAQMDMLGSGKAFVVARPPKVILSHPPKWHAILLTLFTIENPIFHYLPPKIIYGHSTRETSYFDKKEQTLFIDVYILKT